MSSNTPSLSAAERTISHDEAREAALALIDHWFQNANGRRVQTRIPVDPTDTDVVLTDYIEQQRNAEAELSRIRTLLSDREELAKLVARALEEHYRKSFADREAGGMDGSTAVADKLKAYLLGSEGK